MKRLGYSVKQSDIDNLHKKSTLTDTYIYFYFSLIDIAQYIINIITSIALI